MALKEYSGTFATTGSMKMDGIFKICYDPATPNTAPYLRFTSFRAYSSTSSGLPTTMRVAVKVNGQTYSQTPQWSDVISISSTNWRNASFGSNQTFPLTGLTPGNSISITIYLYNDSGTGSLRTYGSGTIWLPIEIELTPPSTVWLNKPNYFSCTPFTIPADYLYTYYAYGYITPGNGHCYLYIDETTPFNSSYGPSDPHYPGGRTVTGFYWYPAASLAKSGDFTDGIGSYRLTFTFSRRSSSSSEAVSTSIKTPLYFPTVQGQIQYNETPPSSAAPGITLTATEVSGSGILAQYGKYVKGKSQVKYTAAVTYKYGAAESHFDLTAASTYITGKTITFWPAAAGSVTAYAEDDHGGEKEVSVNYDVYDYWTPSLTVAIHRCNQDGTRNDGGSYCLIEWGINVAPLGNQNSKSLTITHPAGTSTPTLSSYTASGSLIVAADPEHSYDITFSLTDDFTTVTSTMKLSTAGVIMDIYRGGHGIAFGKVAENDYTLEVTSEWDVLLNTSNAKQINLVDALEALATAAGINIYVQQQNNS